MADLSTLRSLLHQSARAPSRWRRAWQWIVATRARRVALTLAVLAAMAAPFIIGTYDKYEFYSYREVPLTSQTRAIIIAKFEDCVHGAEVPPLAPLPGWSNYSTYWDPPNAVGGCPHARTMLQEGGYREEYLSLWYFAFNGAVMLATLTVTFFALTAAMAAVRKWWRWLW
jgi:hypothetical protein